MGLLFSGAGLALVAALAPILWPAVAAYHAVLLILVAFDWSRLPTRGGAAMRDMPRPLMLGIEQRVEVAVDWPQARGLTVAIADHVPWAVRPLPRVCAGELDEDGSVRLAYSVTPPNRGAYSFGHVDLKLHRPRGLLERRARLAAAESVGVYPNVLPVREYELKLRRGMRFQSGIRRARPPGATTAFGGLRDYTSGDDVRRISWTASARMDKPVSVITEAERGQQLVIAIDCGRLMTAPVGPMAKLDHAVNSALLLAWVGESQGDRVGLATFVDGLRTYLAPQRGAVQINRINRALYAVGAEYLEPDYAQSFSELSARLNRRSVVIVLTDVLDPEASTDLVAHALRLSARHLVVVVAMSDPDVAAARTQPITSAARAYEWAAAEEMVDARRRSFEALRRGGVFSLDVPAGELSARLIERYLELKERALI